MLSAIFCAIEEDNIDGLQRLLSMASIDINQTNQHGESAIHIAAGFGRIDILRYLCDKGGNLGMIDGQGDSAVLWAARQGFPEVIRYLLSKGVHLNQQNKVSSDFKCRVYSIKSHLWCLIPRLTYAKRLVIGCVKLSLVA